MVDYDLNEESMGLEHRKLKMKHVMTMNRMIIQDWANRCDIQFWLLDMVVVSSRVMLLEQLLIGWPF